ncbi:class I SAM-dependent DNA methyltransferase [Agromyces atrinae]|nr:class I SAM-dependent methyltransferase [Agromyces atrinae]NYD68265.1 ubiquinone/menaquinone biosynthesis C-methylase UbiE [Agromyces atrinae]
MDDSVSDAYDTVAESYAALLPDTSAESAADLAAIAEFAELVRSTGGTTVMDVGCGTGRMIPTLLDHGLAVRGCDPSPGMLAVARRTHPDIRFDLGSLTEIPATDDALDGVFAWYSVIHTDPDSLGEVAAELGRVLVPGGVVVLAFQVGNESRLIENAYGHSGLALTAWTHRADRIARALEAAGFETLRSTERAPEGRERLPQGIVIARRAA